MKREKINDKKEIKVTKLNIVVSVFLIIFGLLVIASFAIIAYNKDKNTIMFIPALLLAICFLIMGIIGIRDYKNNKWYKIVYKLLFFINNLNS